MSKVSESVSGNVSQGAVQTNASSSVLLQPTDINPIQVPSPASISVPRNFKNVLIKINKRFDGSEQEIVRGGELSTLLKNQLAMKKGVNLTGVKIYVRGIKENSKIALCFTSALDRPGSFEDIDEALNSVSYVFKASSLGNRFELTPTMPTGLGTQLVPSDPCHPNVHMYYAVGDGFKGTLQFAFTIDCDAVVEVAADFS